MLPPVDVKVMVPGVQTGPGWFKEATGTGMMLTGTMAGSDMLWSIQPAFDFMMTLMVSSSASVFAVKTGEEENACTTEDAP